MLEGLAYRFGGGPFHIGLRLKGDDWITDAGKDVTSLYWSPGNPSENGNNICVCVNSDKLLDDIICDAHKFNGLCIQ